jgi:hypothetical protein
MKIRDSGYYSDVSFEIPFWKFPKRVPPIKLRVHNFLDAGDVGGTFDFDMGEKPLQCR